MNKLELIAQIAMDADISKDDASRVVGAVIDAVSVTLKNGHTVTLFEFGTFAVRRRAARIGRNPRTGASMKIKAAKVPCFRPSKAFKEHLK